jgi:hypothetical protein
LEEPKSRACCWNGKSSTAWARPAVVNRDRNGFENESKTSPKAKKSGRPAAAAVAPMCGRNCCQNSRLTCFIVSMRKPSIRKSRIHVS